MIGFQGVFLYGSANKLMHVSAKLMILCFHYFTISINLLFCNLKARVTIGIEAVAVGILG